MAMITPALLQSLFTGFKKNFEDAKSEAPAQYTKIATVIKSTTKSNTYGWLGKFPSLRKWVGDRVIESMKAHGYQIVNEDFEATVAVDRNDIEDDELGIYAPLFQEMGLAQCRRIPAQGPEGPEVLGRGDQGHGIHPRLK